MKARALCVCTLASCAAITFLTHLINGPVSGWAYGQARGSIQVEVDLALRTLSVAWAGALPAGIVTLHALVRECIWVGIIRARLHTGWNLRYSVLSVKFRISWPIFFFLAHPAKAIHTQE